VRQLANVLERAVILHAGETLGEAEVVALLAAPPEQDEADRLRRALRESGGDKKLAAERLGTSYRELLRRIKALDLGGFPKYRLGAALGAAALRMPGLSAAAGWRFARGVDRLVALGPAPSCGRVS
jgi:transcriptional regulator with PAS, ATPase and Fis domain